MTLMAEYSNPAAFEPYMAACKVRERRKALAGNGGGVGNDAECKSMLNHADMEKEGGWPGPQAPCYY